MNVHFETVSTSRGKQNVWKQVLVAVSKKREERSYQDKEWKGVLQDYEKNINKPHEGLPGYDQEP